MVACSIRRKEILGRGERVQLLGNHAVAKTRFGEHGRPSRLVITSLESL